MKIAISTILTDSYWSRYETLKKSIDNYFLKNEYKQDVSDYINYICQTYYY